MSARRIRKRTIRCICCKVVLATNTKLRMPLCDDCVEHVADCRTDAEAAAAAVAMNSPPPQAA